MARKKIDIAAGIDELLTPGGAEAQGTTGTPTGKPEKIRGNYKSVCYSIPPAVAEKIKYIAYWDRRKINAVVAEALERYAAAWKPAGEKIKKF